MAIKKSTSLQERTKQVFDNPETEYEKMITVSFKIKPSDYKALKRHFSHIGLKIGAGMRFALKKYLNSNEDA